jgi:proteasome lid subunit RPN8/RPN11
MLKIQESEFEALRQHAEETYPYECCGVLLGQFDGDGTLLNTEDTEDTESFCATLCPLC